ncbi:MAG: adenylate/guanylate cyclase domain-containing protein, partial [Burkholderiaceae bacterium]
MTSTPAVESKWAWAVPLLALLLALTAMIVDPLPLRGLRNAVFDQFQRWQPRAYEAPPVRIIDIDEESLRRIGQWPWPRERVAQLLEATQRLAPAAVAVDVLFAEPDRWSTAGHRDAGDGADGDARLARVLAQGNIALGFALTGRAAASDGRRADDRPLLKAGIISIGDDPARFVPRFSASVSNLAQLQGAAAGQGAMTFLPDTDGIVRKVPLMLSLEGRLVPSLTAEALRLASKATQYKVRSAGQDGGLIDVHIGDQRVDTDANGFLWVHYSPARPERYVPAWRILAAEVPDEAIRGHVVLIGTSAQGLLDLRFSPLGGVIPGVEVHAQALEQVLSGQRLSRPGWTPAAEVIAAILGGLVVAVLAMTCGAGGSTAGLLAVVGTFWMGTWMAFSRGHVLVDPVTPTLALLLVFVPTTLLRHLRSERRQRWMKQTFARYVSPNLVDYLVANPQALELGGKRQRCSFVFTDLQGFTALMESMEPAAAVQVLNGYLDRMIAIAFEHDGTLDRIVGDSVAIVFSAPIEQTDHEERALRCALQMHRFARGYVDDLARRGVPFCATRIGVHTGEVTVGNFGGKAIFDYRALGDPVNTAARLEAANKQL